MAAHLLVETVSKLIPYERRKFKLQGSANFKFAKNPAVEMHIWIFDTWIPAQPDKEVLKRLFILVSKNMLEFINFVYHGDNYWQILEKKQARKLPSLLDLDDKMI